MNYLEFKKRVDGFPLFSSSLLAHLGENLQNLRNQLSRWKKQGLILKLRKGMYILNKDNRKIIPSRSFIANQLYSPSYVSTEYALGFYELIPERVVDITSVTPRKTYRVGNTFGTFIYQHINREVFSGFTIMQSKGSLPFLIALPEKAVLDFMYLNLSNFQEDDTDIFEKSFRFQNVGKLNREKILKYAHLFNNKKLIAVANDFLKFVESGQ